MPGPARPRPPRLLRGGPSRRPRPRPCPAARASPAAPSEATAAATPDPTLGDLQAALERVTPEAPAAAAEAALEVAGALRRAGAGAGGGPGLRAFGRGGQVPKRAYTLDELRLHRIAAERVLSPQDTQLDGARAVLRAAVVGGFGFAAFGLRLDPNQLTGLAILGLGLYTADQVRFGGGVGFLAVDTLGRRLNPGYAERVARHEAGHFLVAYLVGVLPAAYTLSSLDAYRRYRAFSVQAGCTFCDAEFRREVAAGKLRSSTLDSFTSIALAGMAAEYLAYGESEGGQDDTLRLDGLLQGLGFTQKKAEVQVRWGLINAVLLLRRHRDVHERLAQAMAGGASVTDCIALIERGVRPEDLAPEPGPEGPEGPEGAREGAA